MNICILSMQNVDNFGSLLQSYALKKMLEKQRHQVAFLPVTPNAEDCQLLESHYQTFPNEGEGRQSFLGKIRKLDQYTLNRLHNKLLYKNQVRLYSQFRREILKAEDGSHKHYDCCVIGSDEVFNCLTESSWGYTGQLFGNIPQADQVITFAASCGATEYEAVPEAVRQSIRKYFQNISAFSVRDTNTARFVAGLSDTPSVHHFDPVVAADFSEEMANAALPENLPDRYCIVYSYYNRFHRKHEIRAIRAFCKRHQMIPVAVGMPQKWISRFLPLEPFQMLKVFENAAFVITDTFHGTIFSAKYARRFGVVIRDSNRNKLQDLLIRMGLEKHTVTDWLDLERVCLVEKNAAFLNNLQQQAREGSELYLQENIHGE